MPMPPPIRMCVLAGLVEREVVERRRAREPVALAQVIVHPGRAAAALDLAQHGDHVAVGLGGVVEQRIRALDAIAERHVDVGAGRERAAAQPSAHKLDLLDRGRHRDQPLDFKVQHGRVSPVGNSRTASCPDGRLSTGTGVVHATGWREVRVGTAQPHHPDGKCYFLALSAGARSAASRLSPSDASSGAGSSADLFAATGTFGRV